MARLELVPDPHMECCLECDRQFDSNQFGIEGLYCSMDCFELYHTVENEEPETKQKKHHKRRVKG